MTQEPTLRHGDVSIDGWVEHRQKHLNTHGATLVPTGTFDDETFAAVVKFQQEWGCIADGVVGDQTWSVIRNGERQMAGTDGREPGTHVEDTFEARWWLENGVARVVLEQDQVQVHASNVGSAPFDATTLPLADAVLTTPDGTEVPLQLVPRNWDGLVVTQPGQNFHHVGTNVAAMPDGNYKIAATLRFGASGDHTEVTFTMGAAT